MISLAVAAGYMSAVLLFSYSINRSLGSRSVRSLAETYRELDQWFLMSCLYLGQFDV